jgi:hypothetical protein
MPVSLLALSVLVHHRWPSVPQGKIVSDLFSSAGWYWVMLLPSAAVGATSESGFPSVAAWGVALGVAACLPCTAGITGRSLWQVLDAAASRRTEFAMIVGSSALGGVAASLVAAVFLRRGPRRPR